MTTPIIYGQPSIRSVASRGIYSAFQRIDNAASVALSNFRTHADVTHVYDPSGTPFTPPSFSVVAIGTLNYYEITIDCTGITSGLFSFDLTATGGDSSQASETVMISVATAAQPAELSPIPVINGALEVASPSQLSVNLRNVGDVFVDTTHGAGFTPITSLANASGERDFAILSDYMAETWPVTMTAYSTANYATRGLFPLSDEIFEDTTSHFSFGAPSAGMDRSYWVVEAGKFQPAKSTQALAWADVGATLAQRRSDDTPNEYTIEGYITPNSISAGGIVFSPSFTTAATWPWRISLVEGALEATGYDGNGVQLFQLVSNVIPVGEETHFALVFKNASVRFFVNGRLVQADPFLANAVVLATLSNLSGPSWQELSSGALPFIYGTPVFDDTMKFYGEQSTYFTSAAQSTRDGQYSALDYRGLPAIGMQDFTIECDFRFQPIGDTAYVIFDTQVADNTRNPAYNEIQLSVNLAGILTLVTTSYGASDNLHYQLPGVMDNYHVAVTRRGTLVTLWVNGVAVASDNTNTVNYTGTHLQVGCGTPPLGGSSSIESPFNGWIGNVRMYVGVAIYGGQSGITGATTFDQIVDPMISMPMQAISHNVKTNFVNRVGFAPWAHNAPELTGLIGSDENHTTPVDAGLRSFRLTERALYNDVFLPPHAPLKPEGLRMDPFYAQTVFDLDLNPNTLRNGASAYGQSTNFSDASKAHRAVVASGGVTAQAFTSAGDLFTPADYYADFGAANVDAYITTASSYDFQYSGNYTIELGFILNSLQTGQQLLNIRQAGNSGQQLNVHFEGGVLFFQGFQGSWNSAGVVKFVPGIPYEVSFNVLTGDNCYTQICVNGQMVAAVKNNPATQASYSGVLVLGSNPALIADQPGWQADYKLWKCRLTFGAVRFNDSYIPSKKTHFSGNLFYDPQSSALALSTAFEGGWTTPNPAVGQFGGSYITDRDNTSDFFRNWSPVVQSRGGLPSKNTYIKSTSVGGGGQIFVNNAFLNSFQGDYTFEIDFAIRRDTLSGATLMAVVSGPSIGFADNGAVEGGLVLQTATANINLNYPLKLDQHHRVSLCRHQVADGTYTVLVFIDGFKVFEQKNANFWPVGPGYQIYYGYATTGEIDLLALNQWGYCRNLVDYNLNNNPVQRVRSDILSAGDPYFENSILIPDFKSTPGADFSKNDNVASIQGSITIANTGPFGNPAATFDGASKMQYLPGSSHLYDHPQTSDMTVQGWVFVSQTGDDQIVFSAAYGANIAFVLYVASNASVLQLSQGTGGSVSSPPIGFDTWAHVAIVLTNGAYYFYVNGQLMGSMAMTQASWTAMHYDFGGGYFESSDGGDHFFHGQLADWDIKEGVALYNGAYAVPTAAAVFKPGVAKLTHVNNITVGSGVAAVFGALSNNYSQIGAVYTTNVVVTNAGSVAAYPSDPTLNNFTLTVTPAVDGDSNPIANTWTITSNNNLQPGAFFGLAGGFELIVVSYTDSTWTTSNGVRRYPVMRGTDTVPDDDSLLLNSLGTLRMWLDTSDDRALNSSGTDGSFNFATQYNYIYEKASSHRLAVDNGSGAVMYTGEHVHSQQSTTYLSVANKFASTGTWSGKGLTPMPATQNGTIPQGGGSLTYQTQSSTRPIANSAGEFTLVFAAEAALGQSQFYPGSLQQSNSELVFSASTTPTTGITPHTLSLIGDKVNEAQIILVDAEGQAYEVGVLPADIGWFTLALRVATEYIELRLNGTPIYRAEGKHNALGWNLAFMGCTTGVGFGSLGGVLAYAGVLSDASVRMAENYLNTVYIADDTVTFGPISPDVGPSNVLFHGVFPLTNQKPDVAVELHADGSGAAMTGWRLDSHTPTDTATWTATGLMPTQNYPLDLLVVAHQPVYDPLMLPAMLLLPCEANVPDQWQQEDVSMLQNQQTSGSGGPTVTYGLSPYPGSGALLFHPLRTTEALTYEDDSYWSVFQNTFTVDLWYFHDVDSVENRYVNLFLVQDVNEPGVFWQLCLNSSSSGNCAVQLRAGSTASSSIVASGPYTPVGPMIVDWHYVRLVVINQVFQLLIDGAVVATGAWPQQPDTSRTRLVIGTPNVADNNQGRLWGPLANQLLMKDVRVLLTAPTVVTDVPSVPLHISTNWSEVDPQVASVLIHLNANGSVGSNFIYDQSPYYRSFIGTTGVTNSAQSPLSLGGQSDSLFFNGESRLDLVSDPAFQLGATDFTIEFDIYLPGVKDEASANNPGHVYEWGFDIDHRFCSYVYHDDVANAWKFSVWTINGGSPAFVDSTVLSTDTWHAIRIVYTVSNNTITVLKDGVVDATLTPNIPNGSGSHIFVLGVQAYPSGIYQPTNPHDPDYFNGYLRRFRVSTVNRGNTPYTVDWQRYPVNPPEYLGDVLYDHVRMQLTGDGTTGSNFITDSSSQNEGFTSNTVTISNAQSPYPNSNALIFDGLTSEMVVPDNIGLWDYFNHDFTWEGRYWFNALNNTGNVANVEVLYESINAQGDVLGLAVVLAASSTVQTNGQIVFYMVYGGVYYQLARSPSLALVSENDLASAWHDIAVVVSGQTVTIFYDGAPVTIAPAAANPGALTITHGTIVADPAIYAPYTYFAAMLASNTMQELVVGNTRSVLAEGSSGSTVTAFFKGYMSALRITSAARYLSNYPRPQSTYHSSVYRPVAVRDYDFDYELTPGSGDVSIGTLTPLTDPRSTTFIGTVTIENATAAQVQAGNGDGAWSIDPPIDGSNTWTVTGPMPTSLSDFNVSISAQNGGAVAPTDPYYSYVVYLLPMDVDYSGQAVDGEYSIYDHSPYLWDLSGHLVKGSIDATNQLFNKPTGAFNLSAPNNWLALESSASLYNWAASDFTIECMVKMPSGGQQSYPAMWQMAEDSAGTMWAANSLSIAFAHPAAGGNPGLFIYNYNSTQPLLACPDSILDNQWHHLAVVRHGTLFAMYLDGARVAVANWSGNTGSSNAMTAYIAGDPYSGLSASVLGNIANYRVTKYARYAFDFNMPTAPWPDNGANVPAAPGTVTPMDPYFENVVFLNHFEIANGNTTGAAAIVDSGPRALTPVGNSGQRLATTQHKFGASAFAAGAGSATAYSSATAQILTQDFTFEAWVYNATSGPPSCWFGQIDGSNQAGDFFVGTSAGNGSTLAFWQGGVVKGTSVDAGLIQGNTWVHVAAVRCEGVTTVYYNGNPVISFADTANYNSTSHYSLAYLGSGMYDWTGFIDDARLTIGIARYTAAFTPSNRKFPDTGPITAVPDAYFSANVASIHFEGADDSTDFNDFAGHCVPSAIGGAVVRQGSQSVLGASNTHYTLAPKYGQGMLYLNGSDAAMALNPLIASDLQFAADFTFEFWAFDMGSSGCLWSTPGGIFMYQGVVQGLGQNISYNPTSGDTGSWVHYAIVRQGGTVSVYHNGVLAGTESNFNSTVDLSGLVFGKYLPNNNLYWTGCIDDIRITANYCRYTGAFTPPTAPYPDFGPATVPAGPPTPANAQLVTLPQTALQIYASGTNPATWLKFVLTYATAVNINTIGSGMDTKIAMYDAAGNFLGSDDDSGGNLTSSYTSAVLQPGTYYALLGFYPISFSNSFGYSQPNTGTGHLQFGASALTPPPPPPPPPPPGAPPSGPPAPPPDPAILMMHFEAGNGSTDFEDSGPYALTFAALDSAATIDTSLSVVGGSSMISSGSSGIYTPWPSTLTTLMEFTVEFTWRSSNVGAKQLALWTHLNNVNGDPQFIIFFDAGQLAYYTGIYGSSDSRNYFPDFTFVNDTWYKIAVTRDSAGNVRAFVNGIMSSTTFVDNRDMAKVGGNIVIGNGAFPGSPVQHLDEMRFSKTCLYTSAYTPPARLGVVEALDLYSSDLWGAYNLHRVRSDFTGSPIRVRRSQDNTEMDVPFTAGGRLDVNALLLFAGSGYAWVTTFYDQSSQGHHFVQTNTGSQPRIVNNGVYDGAAYFDGTSMCMQSAVAGTGGNLGLTVLMSALMVSNSVAPEIFLESSPEVGPNNGALLVWTPDQPSTPVQAIMATTAGTAAYNYYPNGFADGRFFGATFDRSFSGNANSQINAWVDATEMSPSSTGGTSAMQTTAFDAETWYLGARAGNRFFANMYVSGFVIFETALSSSAMSDVLGRLGPVAYDPHWDKVLLLVRGDEVKDLGPNNLPIQASISTVANAANARFGRSTLYTTSSGDTLGLFTVEAAGSDELDLNNSDYTIEAMVKAISDPLSRANAFALFANGGNAEYLLYVYNGGQLVAHEQGGGQVYSETTSGGGVVHQNYPAYDHVALVKSGTTLMAFVNGQLVASTTSPVRQALASRISVGVYAPGTPYYFPFVGWMSDVRITKYARYTAPFVPQGGSWPVGFTKKYTPSTAPYVLDPYEAGVWGVFALQRLLRSYNGPLLRLRRADNAESDIGFLPNGAIDVAGMEAWASGQEAYITTWYDQSGRGNHFLQPNAGSQPRVCLSGTYQGVVQFVASQAWCMYTLVPTSGFFPGASIFLQADLLDKTSPQQLLELSDNYNNNTGTITMYWDGSNLVVGTNSVSGNGSGGASTVSFLPKLDGELLAMRWDLTQTGDVNQMAMWEQGTKLTPTANGGNVITGELNSYRWHLGSRNDSQSFATMHVTALVIYEATKSDSDMLNLQNALKPSSPAVYDGVTLDPYWDSVSMLLHMNGYNGQQTFRDAACGTPITPIGLVHTTQIQSPFSGNGESSAMIKPGDYLNVPTYQGLNFGTNDFTMEFWVRRLQSTALYGAIIATNDTVADAQAYYVGIEPGGIIRCGGHTLDGTGGGVAVTTNPVTDQNWHHVAWTRISGLMTVYLDGVAQSTATWAGVIDFTGAGLGTNIGRDVWDGSDGALSAELREFRVTNGAGRYTANFTLPQGVLPEQGYDANLAQTVFLLNGNTLTDVKGHVVQQQGTVTNVFTDPDFPHGAIAFTPSNTLYVTSYGAEFNFGTGDFTVEVDFKPTVVGVNYPCVFCTNLAGTDNTGQIRIFADSEAQFPGNWGIAMNGAFVYNAPIVANQVIQVALSRVSGVTYIFVNGVQVTSFSDTATYNLETGISLGSFEFGGSADSNSRFTGLIGKVRLTKGVGRYSLTPYFPKRQQYPLLGQASIPADPYWSNVALLAHFDDATLRDETGRHVLTSVNPVNIDTLNTAVGSGSLLLNRAASDYVVTADNSSDWEFGLGDFTLEGWIKTSSTAHEFSFLDNWLSAAGNTWQFQITLGGYPTLYMNGAYLLPDGSIGSVRDGNWHHVAIVRAGDTITSFIDGQIAVSATGHAGTYFSSQPKLGIGCQVNQLNTSYCFDGNIDEVRITKGVARYLTNFTTSHQPDGQGKRVADPYWDDVLLLVPGSSAFADAGPLHQTVVAQGAAVLTSAQTKFGTNSMYLGDSSFVDAAASSLNISASDYTAEAWVYPLDLPGDDGEPMAVVCNFQDQGHDHYFLAINRNGSVWIAEQFTISEGGAAYQATSATGIVSNNAWHHFALVKQGGTLMGFVDGVMVCSVTSPVFTNHPPYARLGRFADGGYVWPLTGYAQQWRVTASARYTAEGFAVPNLAFPTGGFGDPHWLNVSMLLHADGMDAGSSIIDSSPLAHTTSAPYGAVTTSATTVFAGGTSMYFPGNAVLLVANDASLEMQSDDFTLEVMVNFSDLSNTRVIVTKDVNTGYYNYQLLYNLSDQTIKCRLAGADTSINTLTTSAATSPISTGVWYHIAVVRSGSTFTMLLNGTVVSTTTFSGQLYQDGGHFAVGGFEDNEHPEFTFIGYMDELRLTKGVARYLVNHPTPLVPHPMQASDPYFDQVGLLLHMDGANGSTTFVDSSSHGFIVTGHGGVALDTSVSKFGGSSVALTAQTTYLTVPHNAAIDPNSGDFTVEAWINWDGTVYDRAAGVVSKRQDGGDDGWSMVLTNTFPPNMRLYSSASGSIFGTLNITANTWHHVAWVISAGHGYLFLDGVLDQTAGFVLPANAYNLWVGTDRSDLERFPGHIDEVRITKFARYTASFEPPVSPYPNS